MCVHVCVVHYFMVQKSGKLYHTQDSVTRQHNAATLVAATQGAVGQNTQLTRATSSTNFTEERKAHVQHVQDRSEDKLLAAPYTPANYKDKFRLLINREEEEHVEALKQ